MESYKGNLTKWQIQVRLRRIAIEIPSRTKGKQHLGPHHEEEPACQEEEEEEEDDELRESAIPSGAPMSRHLEQTLDGCEMILMETSWKQNRTFTFIHDERESKLPRERADALHSS